MKIKIFNGGDREAMERSINEWLQTQNVRNIHHLTHTNDGATMYITVWWSE
jgi:hypothetical protein